MWRRPRKGFGQRIEELIYEGDNACLYAECCRQRSCRRLPRHAYRDTITDTTAPLGAISIGGTLQGNIETNGDTDVFSVSLIAGQVYTFSARGAASGGGTLGDPMLELRNSAGTLVASNDDEWHVRFPYHLHRNLNRHVLPGGYRSGSPSVRSNLARSNEPSNLCRPLRGEHSRSHECSMYGKRG